MLAAGEVQLTVAIAIYNGLALGIKSVGLPRRRSGRRIKPGINPRDRPIVDFHTTVRQQDVRPSGWTATLGYASGRHNHQVVVGSDNALAHRITR